MINIKYKILLNFCFLFLNVSVISLLLYGTYCLFFAKTDFWLVILIWILFQWKEFWEQWRILYRKIRIFCFCLINPLLGAQKCFNKLFISFKLWLQFSRKYYLSLAAVRTTQTYPGRNISVLTASFSAVLCSLTAFTWREFCAFPVTSTPIWTPIGTLLGACVCGFGNISIAVRVCVRVDSTTPRPFSHAQKIGFYEYNPLSVTDNFSLNFRLSKERRGGLITASSSARVQIPLRIEDTCIFNRYVQKLVMGLDRERRDYSHPVGKTPDIVRLEVHRNGRNAPTVVGKSRFRNSKWLSWKESVFPQCTMFKIKASDLWFRLVF